MDMNLKEMRSNRYIYQAVYMEFAEKTKYHMTHAFCFYEGEDGKYYDSRIRAECSDDIITFRVENKTGVLKLYEKIKSSSIYDDVCKMFFIDRDCDEDKYDNLEDLYVTTGYSVENWYVSKECFAKILQSEFGMDLTGADFKKCIDAYNSRESEFNDLIFDFNVLVKLRHDKMISNSKCSFGDIKTSSLVCIDLNRVKKADGYIDIIKSIMCKLNVDEKDVKVIREQMSCINNVSNIFRGKNQLDFFVEFIRKLKEKNKVGGYLSKKYNCVRLEITKNRLSELSQYANTDSSLKSFIREHKEILKKNRMA